MVAQARRLRTQPLTISDKDQDVLSCGDGLLYDALLTSTYYSPGVVGEISIHRWPGGVTNTLFVTSLGDGQSFTDPANNLQITQNSHNDSSVTFTVFVGLQPPTNLAATPGDSRVTLSWTANAGATGYNVKRATTSGGPLRHRGAERLGHHVPGYAAHQRPDLLLRRLLRERGQKAPTRRKCRQRPTASI
jgi:hypothetical protein